MMRAMKEENLNRISTFIKDYIADSNGISPSLSEIMKHTGMVKSTVYRHIKELERRGVVYYSGKNTLRIENQEKMSVLYSRVPVLGTIPCGSPTDCNETIDGYVAVPDEWVEGECYLLRASGDSMIDIGIGNKDLVLIKVCEDANFGDVVVALTNKGNTLKRYIKDNQGRICLLAENSNFSESERYIYSDFLKIQGKALKVIKDIR